MPYLRTIPCLSILVLLGACGGDERDVGSPPVVRSLELSPRSAAVGELATLRGSIDFEDPDGDVLELHSSLVAPDGTRTDVAPAPVAGASGTPAGSVAVQLSVRFVATGDHTLTVWLRDAQGNDSNQLTETIAVGP